VLVEANTLASRDFDAGQVIILDSQLLHPIGAAYNGLVVAPKVAMLVNHRRGFSLHHLPLPVASAVLEALHLLSPSAPDATL